MSDTWERVQLASARVPFRLKVAVVWVVRRELADRRSATLRTEVRVPESV